MPQEALEPGERTLKSKEVVITIALEKGLGYVRDLREAVNWNVPFANDIRRFQPEDRYFIDKTMVTDRTHHHGLGHVARTLMLGWYVTKIRELDGHQANWLAIGDALGWHDAARNAPNHGAVAAFLYRSSHMVSSPRSELAAQLIEYHANSDVSLGEELSIVRTVDACDRVRFGTPIEQIRIEMEQMRGRHLPEIAKLLWELSSQADGHDGFEGVIYAGELLGLLRPSFWAMYPGGGDTYHRTRSDKYV